MRNLHLVPISILLAATHLVHAGTLDAPVVGGTPVNPGDYPDVVAVLTRDGSLCTGTLVGTDLVLTAAHCIGGVPDLVIAGSVDLAARGGERRAVKWSKAYPDWETTFDVGIIMLDHPFAVKPRPIAQGCSPTRIARAPLELVGFGQTTATATDRNTQLHVATLSVLDPTCERDASCNREVAPDGELVAGGHGRDACFGDSGGPLYIETGTGLAQLGIVSRGLVSWATPCGEGGVFVRADAEPVVAWIEKSTGRKLERAACDVPADASPADETDTADVVDGGGCQAGGGPLGAAVAFVLGLGGLGLAATLRVRRRTAGH